MYLKIMSCYCIVFFLVKRVTVLFDVEVEIIFFIFYCFKSIMPVQANLPKEIADYLNKMGARIPNIKPGKATIEYLTKIQASTRFWGMILP